MTDPKALCFTTQSRQLWSHSSIKLSVMTELHSYQLRFSSLIRASQSESRTIPNDWFDRSGYTASSSNNGTSRTRPSKHNPVLPDFEFARDKKAPAIRPSYHTCWRVQNPKPEGCGAPEGEGNATWGTLHWGQVLVDGILMGMLRLLRSQRPR